MREVNPNIFLSIPPSGLSCLLSSIIFSPSFFLPYMGTNPLALAVLESAQVYVLACSEIAGSITSELQQIRSAGL